MTKRKQPSFVPWQVNQLQELRAIARARPRELRCGAASEGPEGDACVPIELNTDTIEHVAGGLELHGWEPFVLRIPASPFHPPTVEVTHTRFLGFPHVLQGLRLCIYLDPAREWHPQSGVSATLNRLWGWLIEAAAARFDPSTAMYHAVGGVLHRTPGTPTVVAREDLPALRVTMATLHRRTDARFDLTWRDRGEVIVPVVRLFSDLPFGATESLVPLLYLIDHPTADVAAPRAFGPVRRDAPLVPAFTTMLIAAALRSPANSPQYFVLAVPHGAGGPPHLLCGRLTPAVANALRTVGRKRGTALDLNPTLLDVEVPIEWCNMSDEREAVTTRRDVDRPVNGFAGKSVHVWGCGGLGSWIAEFVVRAGAREVTICDPGVVTGGLLVRQNYTETSIGETKAQALATRLRSLRDDIVVHVADGAIPDDLAAVLGADIVIDATVSNAVTSVLDATTEVADRRAVIAQVATDVASGTLGLVTICPSRAGSPSSVDDRVGRVVGADPALELYHGLWRDPLAGDEIVPTRGCSVPTFHGSAADLAAVAGVLTSLIGTHLAAGSATAGAHLIALPHASAGPRHHFVPVTAADISKGLAA